MASPILLVATWFNGLFVIDGSQLRHEMAGRRVQGLIPETGSVLAILDEHILCRRRHDGTWDELAKSESPLSCCLISGGDIFVGTNDDAHLLRLDRSALHRVGSFDATPGRDKWAAGAMLVDGKMMGPPLGIRSMSASSDGATFLANVHIGGIPRTTDRGATWHPTIAIETDVHQVVCHPSRPDLAAAAAAAGLCISRDGGATWQIETDGLHESYCSAVAFVDDDIFVAASASHFAKEGAVYRRRVDDLGPLMPLGGGMPRWTEGIVDTAGIAVHGRNAAIVDRAGNVYSSRDAGATWAKQVKGPSGPSGAVFV